MAKYVATDVSVTVGGTDMSDHCVSATLELDKDEIEDTAFGSTLHTYVAGLTSARVSLSFQDDHAASEISQIINTNFGSTASVVMKPTSGTTSSTNESHTLVCLVSQQRPIAGRVGELATFDVTWPVNSWTRGTA